MVMEIKALIQFAIDILGSEQKLADACGVSQPAINALKRRGSVSARIAHRIDAVTNGLVPKHLLCPDVFAPPAFVGNGGPVAHSDFISSSSGLVAGPENTTNESTNVAHLCTETVHGRR